MAAAPAKKNDAKKAGGEKKKKGRSISGLYNISSGKIERKNRFCPKCGPGYFLGTHSNRLVCGNCKYVEYLKK